VKAEALAHVTFIPQFLVTAYVGEMFTVACVVESVNNLSGVSLMFSWNTTCLGYVAHTLTVPVEDFSSLQAPSPYPGIIHTPEIVVQDRVEEYAGTYEVAVATLGESAFNGSGTLFTMTFHVSYIPMSQNYIDTSLHFDHVELGDPDAQIITHTEQDGIVRILGWDVDNHDLAVMKVYTAKNGCLPVPTIGQGYRTDVFVEVEHQGEFTETFDVVVYANFTRCDVLSLVSLTQGTSAVFTVRWDTSGLVKGWWMVTAVVECSGDIEASDNSLADGVILVTLPGDVDGDKDVDIFDMVAMAGSYGSEEGDPSYVPNYDIDDDNEIDIFDIVAAASHYGENW
jgi:hypothetical protein